MGGIPNSQTDSQNLANRSESSPSTDKFEVALRIRVSLINSLHTKTQPAMSGWEKHWRERPNNCRARLWRNGLGGGCYNTIRDTTEYIGNDTCFCMKHSIQFDQFLIGEKKTGWHGIYMSDDWGQKLNGKPHPWKKIAIQEEADYKFE